MNRVLTEVNEGNEGGGRAERPRDGDSVIGLGVERESVEHGAWSVERERQSQGKRRGEERGAGMRKAAVR